MKLTNSLTNMLGEFVAIQKSPEFKPCSVSMQELNKAIKAEKKWYSMKTREGSQRVNVRTRYLSMGDVSVSQDVSMSPAGRVTMRPSAKRSERPTSLVERIKQRISPTRDTEAITEEEEGDSKAARRLSTQSEKLHITIV